MTSTTTQWGKPKILLDAKRRRKTAQETTPLLGGGEEEDQNKKPVTIVLEEKDKTRSRRLAKYLSRHKWYNPNPRQLHTDGTTETTSSMLDAAWDYFEFYTLRRYEVHPLTKNAKDERQRADPGEKEIPTKLYPVLETAEKDCADFGIGVGVYFFTLRALSAILFLAGILNIPTLVYFASAGYESDDGVVAQSSVSWVLQTSAICLDQSWEACPNCRKEQWNEQFPPTLARYGEAMARDGSVLTFTRVNHCEITAMVGIVSYLSLVFVFVSVLWLQKNTEQYERHLDEAEQTTEDYSIYVANPPSNALQADEWRTFFSQFGHVTCCTVALDNWDLIQALVARRQLMLNLAQLQPADGVKVDGHTIAAAVASASAVPWYLKLVSKDAKTIQKELAAWDEKIDSDLSLRDYSVSGVFVTFELERHQQKALSSLSVRGMDRFFRSPQNVLSPDLLFRGQVLLNISEPPSPSSIRWMDLDTKRLASNFQSLVAFLLTVLVIGSGCFVITYVRMKHGIVYAAITVSSLIRISYGFFYQIMNSVTPNLCRLITDTVESHANEGSKQASLYYKMTASVWIYTAIITAAITSFVNTLENDRQSLIPAMFAIYVSELFLAPVQQVLDLGGHFQRHVLAPRATDQNRMKTYFQGTSYELSELYMRMTNILFYTCFYAVVFPIGFFFGGCTLLVRYYADKFCLLRTWAPAPHLDKSIASLSRNVFFTAILAFYATMSSYMFAHFPYDNACVDQNPVPSEYIGNFTVVNGEGTHFQTTITSDASNYYHCNQDMMSYIPPAFPAVPSRQPEGGEWMADGQLWFSPVFGWTSVGVLAALGIVLLDIYRKWLLDFFLGTKLYDTAVVSSDEPFSKYSLSAYAPQMKSPGDIFPTLFFDTSGLQDLDLVGWDAPDKNYDMFNAFLDVPDLKRKPVFSTVKHWPPPLADGL